jgi:acyl-CoA hydrolase
MEVGIKVIAEDTRSKTIRHVMSSFFTMVSVDKDRKPCAVPKLVLENEIEKRRYEEAQIRKKLRADYEASSRTVRQK